MAFGSMSLLGGGGGADPGLPGTVAPDQQPAPAGVLGGMGQMGAAPQQTNSLPDTPPTPTPVAAPAPTPHESRVARAVRSILGTQVDYKVDPATGQTVAMPVKSSGSDIFRGILAGALLGAEAGQAAHTPNPDAGAMAGFAAGGGAAVRQNTAVDAIRRQRAQEDFKNSIESRKADQELLLQQAQIAHMHAEDLHANAMMDLTANEFLQKMNESNGVLEAKYEEKGTVPSISLGGQNINGKMGNGYDIMNAVNTAKAKNQPSPLDPPQGYHRVHTQTVDTSGLHFKVGTGWVDDKDQSVDMATRTTHKFFDVPNNTMNEAVTMSNKEWNKAIGSTIFPNDDKPRTGTYSDLIAMKDKATHESREAAQTRLIEQKTHYEIALIGKQAAALQNEISKGADRDMRVDIQNLQEQAKILQGQIKSMELPTSKEEIELKAEAQKQLSGITSTMNTMFEQHLKKQGISLNTPPPVNKVDSVFNMLAQYPPDQQLVFAQGATTLSPQDKAELIKRVQARVGATAPPAAPPAAPGTQDNLPANIWRR